MGWEARLSASESQVGSRRLPRPPGCELGPGCASPAGPSQLGGGCSGFRLSHGWRPPSRSSTRACQPCSHGPGVPQERSVFLSAAGSANAAAYRGQRSPRPSALRLSPSPGRLSSAALALTSPVAGNLPPWPLRCSGRLGQPRPPARLCLARASRNVSLWELFYFFGFCSSFLKKLNLLV